MNEDMCNVEELFTLFGTKQIKYQTIGYKSFSFPVDSIKVLVSNSDLYTYFTACLYGIKRTDSTMASTYTTCEPAPV